GPRGPARRGPPVLRAGARGPAGTTLERRVGRAVAGRGGQRRRDPRPGGTDARPGGGGHGGLLLDLGCRAGPAAHGRRRPPDRRGGGGAAGGAARPAHLRHALTDPRVPALVGGTPPGR